MSNFSELTKFALDVLNHPHSNADCERVFSSVNCMKTKIRNRLNTDTINGALHTKQHLSNNGNCITFKPTKNMINCMTKNILYKNSINENDATIFGMFENCWFFYKP